VPRDGGVIAIEIPKERLREFCRKWKVTEFALFGSVTRPEEFRPDSDVDVLVRFANDARISLFDLYHMEEELKAIFGRDIDLSDLVAIERSRNPLRRESILTSAVPVEL
jgi:predicted nucleotidyltransferase